MSSIKQNQEDRNERFQMLAFTIVGFGGILLLAHLYYANYDLVCRLCLDITYFDTRVLSMRPIQALLGSYWRGHNVILICFAFLFACHFRGARPDSFWKQVLGLAMSVLGFYGCRVFWLLPPVLGQVLYIFGSLISCGYILHYSACITRFYLTSSYSLSDNEKWADGFEQMTELIETPVSINWKYEFSYLGKKRLGYINEISPFRASFVLGMPGTGKSFSFLDVAMKQLIAKHFSAAVYDYKDPTLSNDVYQYYVAYKKNNPNSNLRFGYLSYLNINYTYRCNPMKGISTSAEATNFANAILIALNKNFAEKQGEFFTESAKSFTAIVIYALGVLHNGRYLSLPHTIAMLSRVPSVLFPALKLLSVFYPDMQNLFSPFKEAYDNNVLPQLQGQLASAQIGLGAMSDASLAFVMTEEEGTDDAILDLEDVSSPQNPMLLCLGSNPKIDKILGLANSVYLTRLVNVLNRKGRKQTALFADEVHTVHINGLDQFIATARSNKVATFLGFQDFSQIQRDYGQKIADATINTVNNVFVGAVKGTTAKSFSDSFGKKTVKKISKSISDDGKISTTISEQKEDRISQDIIEQLSQGEFIGRVADEADNNIKCKMFHGKVLVETTEDERLLREQLEASAAAECAKYGFKYVRGETPIAPMVRHWSDMEMKRRLRLNMIRINNEVSDVLAKLNELAEKLSILIRLTSSKDQFGLPPFIDNPGDPETHIRLWVWLEEAYSIVLSLDKLELKDDILTFEEKFQLLLRDVYTTSYEGLQTILEARKNDNLTDMPSVQKRIEEYATRH